MMDWRDMLAQCGLVVKGGGRVVRATARELLPLLSAKIDRLMRLVKAYERRMAEQQAEISRLKAELEDAGRSGHDAF
jgi:chaperonin cofactor prefoldin